ncbi:MAG: SH3 domain-containing protein [Alphaproteobacteria bacterium]|nr:SH3 domain-containing protein [Alphaproteobacteria bacterium]MBV9372865.1 SH3 domain-containing protein [Alphaproteobacteria bacterium]MBV9902053.1 SH3 domain-containing protein [Alphaproteobacteria bacterium]
MRSLYLKGNYSIGMMRLFVLSVLPVLNFSVEAGAYPNRPHVPVIAGRTDIAQCNAARIVRTSLGSGRLLSLRAGPGTSYARIGRITPGQTVFTCDERGQWIGIVFSHHGASCTLRSARRVGIDLPKGCQSGWVARRWVEVISG